MGGYGNAVTGVIGGYGNAVEPTEVYLRDSVVAKRVRDTGLK